MITVVALSISASAMPENIIGCLRIIFEQLWSLAKVQKPLFRYRPVKFPAHMAMKGADRFYQ